MSKYLRTTYARIVWRFNDQDGQRYSVLELKGKQSAFHIFHEEDIEEFSYYVLVNKTFTRLTKTITSLNGFHYVVAKNNAIHCETGPAICCPCGLDSFKVNEDVEDYLLRGKIFSHHTWLLKIKETTNWTQVMANVLGSKN